MSAAATAAGYLYASGRLRGKNKEDGDRPERRDERQRHAPERREVRVAVIHREAATEAATEKPEAQKRQPKIQYRTRRWKPEE